MAKQRAKGGPRDGSARDVGSLPKQATRSYETAKGVGKTTTSRGTPNTARNRYGAK